MLLKYHQSLKDLSRKNLKIDRPMRPITADIYSQAPDQDSSYMIDSFVVEDVEEEVSDDGLFFLCISGGQNKNFKKSNLNYYQLKRF
jgi:hypothetical protein